MRRVLGLVVLAVLGPAAVGQHADAEVNALVGLLKDRRSSSENRNDAYRRLGKIASKDRTVVPVLAELAGDPVAGLNALFALGYVEPPPKEAIGPLFRLVESAPVDRRIRFAGVLARAGAPRHDLLPLLTRIVRDDGGVRSSSDGRYYEIANGRQYAAALLRAMGPEAAPATPALAAALKGYLDRPSITLGESRLLEACTKALGAIGPDAREALPVLETLAKDKHRWLRTIALEAIAKIRGETGGLATVPDGVELFTDIEEPFIRLSDPAAEQRRQAVLTLAAMGPRAKAARHALLGLLRDPDLEVRLLAAYALEQIEGKK